LLVTLLEALVALVILGLVAVGLLGAMQGSARSTYEVQTWAEAVGYAGAAMEETKLGTSAHAATLDQLPAGFRRAIDVQPWAGSQAVAEVTVTVTLPGGRSFVLHRLARRP
jgi:Tfp pilus assembly protein PilV